ncbi:hypothetical protein GCM10020219_059490 [Nonomuraea dietziae]
MIGCSALPEPIGSSLPAQTVPALNLTLSLALSSIALTAARLLSGAEALRPEPPSDAWQSTKKVRAGAA